MGWNHQPGFLFGKAGEISKRTLWHLAAARKMGGFLLGKCHKCCDAQALVHVDLVLATTTRPGKHTKNWWENRHFQWVNQLFLWPFSIAMLVYQRVYLLIFSHTWPHLRLSSPPGLSLAGLLQEPQELCSLAALILAERRSTLQWNVAGWEISYKQAYEWENRL